MTDDDLLARADAWDASYYPGELIEELAAALRARDSELADARTAVQAVIDAVEAGDVAEAPYSDTLPALRAWLASVATTPTDREEDGSCQHCGGKGCIACDARHLAATPTTPEVREGPVWADPYLTEPGQETINRD